MNRTRRGFTLIELLVVIGILAVLIAVISMSVGGAAESARNAKCKSNLRSLANAANAIAAEGSPVGHYPMARHAYFETPSTGADAQMYGWWAPGWVSWSKSNMEIPFYGTENQMDNIYALTNGASTLMWRALGGNADVYKCPTFVKNFRKNHTRDPIFTYVMNTIFGPADENPGNWQAYCMPGTLEYGAITRADRVLMFAELPRRVGYNESETKYALDGCLQYRRFPQLAALSNIESTSRWNCEAESIGFVHKGNHGRYYGNVVFVDAHVESIAEPHGAKDGKGGGAGMSLSCEDLTAVLCEGMDYRYDSSGYHLCKPEDLQ